MVVEEEEEEREEEAVVAVEVAIVVAVALKNVIKAGGQFPPPRTQLSGSEQRLSPCFSSLALLERLLFLQPEELAVVIVKYHSS